MNVIKMRRDEIDDGGGGGGAGLNPLGRERC